MCAISSFHQVCYAQPEGVCPVGDVQAEGFLYLGLVQNGVGGAVSGLSTPSVASLLVAPVSGGQSVAMSG